MQEVERGASAKRRLLPVYVPVETQWSFEKRAKS